MHLRFAHERLFWFLLLLPNLGFILCGYHRYYDTRRRHSCPYDQVEQALRPATKNAAATLGTYETLSRPPPAPATQPLGYLPVPVYADPGPVHRTSLVSEGDEVSSLSRARIFLGCSCPDFFSPPPPK